MRFFRASPAVRAGTVSKGDVSGVFIPAFLAKGSGTVALTWLYLLGRVSSQWLAIGAVDGVFAILFLVAFWATRSEFKKRVLNARQ